MEENKFVLEDLFRLAKEEPEHFELVRNQLIQNAISSSSPENIPRLERMQWRIDNERHTFKGGQYQFANYLFGQMWSKFLELDAHLKAFRTSTARAKRPKLKPL